MSTKINRNRDLWAKSPEEVQEILKLRKRGGRHGNPKAYKRHGKHRGKGWE